MEPIKVYYNIIPDAQSIFKSTKKNIDKKTI